MSNLTKQEMTLISMKLANMLASDEKFLDRLLQDLIRRKAFKKLLFQHLKNCCDNLSVKENAIKNEDKDLYCPVCGKPLRISCNKTVPQYFVGCTGYPDCKYTRQFTPNDEKRIGISERVRSFYNKLAKMESFGSNSNPFDEEHSEVVKTEDGREVRMNNITGAYNDIPF